MGFFDFFRGNTARELPPKPAAPEKEKLKVVSPEVEPDGIDVSEEFETPKKYSTEAPLSEFEGDEDEDGIVVEDELTIVEKLGEKLEEQKTFEARAATMRERAFTTDNPHERDALLYAAKLADDIGFVGGEIAHLLELKTKHGQRDNATGVLIAEQYLKEEEFRALLESYEVAMSDVEAERDMARQNEQTREALRSEIGILKTVQEELQKNLDTLSVQILKMSNGLFAAFRKNQTGELNEKQELAEAKLNAVNEQLNAIIAELNSMLPVDKQMKSPSDLAHEEKTALATRERIFHEKRHQHFAAANKEALKKRQKAATENKKNRRYDGQTNNSPRVKL